MKTKLEQRIIIEQGRITLINETEQESIMLKVKLEPESSYIYLPKIDDIKDSIAVLQEFLEL